MWEIFTEISALMVRNLGDLCSSASSPSHDASHGSWGPKRLAWQNANLRDKMQILTVVCWEIRGLPEVKQILNKIAE